MIIAVETHELHKVRKVYTIDPVHFASLSGSDVEDAGFLEIAAYAIAHRKDMETTDDELVCTSKVIDVEIVDCGEED